MDICKVVLPDGYPVWAERHWGFVPRWPKAQTRSNRYINARSETIAEKPMFRQAFLNRRCLILASGFYEWQNTGSAKQPYFIYDKQNPVLTFAGVWASWTENGNTLESCAILTRSASGAMADVHPRMPLIIPAENRNDWLAGSDVAAALITKLQHRPLALTYHRVGKAIGNPRYDCPDCVREVL